MKIGTANVETMAGRCDEVVDMANRRKLDVCCLQETRWKGGGARTIGCYKFFWAGVREGRPLQQKWVFWWRKVGYW